MSVNQLNSVVWIINFISIHIPIAGRLSRTRMVNFPILMDFFLGDALNSVRQLTSANGDITSSHAYEPFGEVAGSAGQGITSFGFAGEWATALDGIDLTYLRARWYAPYLNQFIQPDPIAPSPYFPTDWNRYSYARNSPINLTDPSGLTPYEPPDEAPNHRDLTRWLYGELTTNANGYYAQTLKRLNSSIWTLDRVKALAGWAYLVKDKAKWDFKHKIQDEMRGRSVLLRFPRGYEWIEYSVPGNIHYGFVGRASGFSGALLHMGASYAEITDPAHANQGESCCPEICMVGHVGPVLFEYCKNIGCYYINPEWFSGLFDDPDDFDSVEFGVKLFNTHGSNPTFTQFESFLASHVSELTKAPYIPDWKWINPRSGWPYQVGRFDGPDTQINSEKVRFFLGGSRE
ncbi:MAG: RHS repeat-associated core domain-containing protein [Anaerolineales bacterium]